MRILICGSRHWTNQDFIYHTLLDVALESMLQPNEVTIISGGAKGADTHAENIAKLCGCMLEVFPANWSKFGKSAGPRRNIQMLDSGVDLVLAFSPDLTKSKGTAHTVREARKRNIPTRVFNG